MQVGFDRWCQDAGWAIESAAGTCAMQSPADGARDASASDASISDANPSRAVIYFGGSDALSDGHRHDELRARHPGAVLMGCSTGGQIDQGTMSDDGVVAIVLDFAHTRLKLASQRIAQPGESFACGRSLGEELAGPELAGVFVLSDGLAVNGSALAAGLGGAIGTQVPVTGGLAGDAARFAQTLVAAQHRPEPGVVAALGFYGAAVRIGHGSAGGWDVFGPRRRITRSTANVLYELDHQPAIELYRRYLGDEDFAELPGSALLFPLMMSNPRGDGCDLVRTVLAVDLENGSMTFAGDMPEGATAQLMRGNMDRLAAGAADAAALARRGMAGASGDEAAILVSCIGRRLLMGQRIGDEIDAACGALGSTTRTFGFYSYGEFSPDRRTGFAELHNQTMTVVHLSEMSDAA